MDITLCWKTSDGEVFDIESEAIYHQKRLNRCVKIDCLLKDANTQPSKRTQHEDAVITDFLMGNWGTLYNLFKEEGDS